MKSEFRHLPSIDKVLINKRVKQCEKEFPHELVLSLTRQSLERERLSIATGNPCSSIDEIVECICTQLHYLEKSSLCSVINATGVILHTNLGRAPLSHEAVEAMRIIATSYSNLEFDLDSGARGSRHSHIESLLCNLTGAEAALVVNNNSSALLLGLTAIARKKEIIVSRGQAVEIGGGFRIPEVIAQSGVKLVEVGTTNCTYITDYERSISPRTVALIRVHSSNFKISGFTHSVSLEELVEVGRQNNILVLDDLGSGCFLDTRAFGLPLEPTVQQSIAAGAGLVFFSGDKLIGGPQAGIIVGRKELVENLKKHPLARAVRIDKIRLAGLIATMIHYTKGQSVNKIPVWSMISAPLKEIDHRARIWANAIGTLAQVRDGESMIGGGSFPGSTLPTKLVTIEGKDIKALTLAQRLRIRKTPIIGRISANTLMLDPRSVLPEEDEVVLSALRKLVAPL
ncbi:L-seryl-tRNA(Sec) selenium transferase [Chloroflexota bacterium]